jgi:hypothetical protein
VRRAPAYKKKVLAAGDIDTIVTGKRSATG